VWQKAGFGLEHRDGTWHLDAREVKNRTSPDSMEVWAINYAEDKRSLQRR
jgi:hypothetical protein